MTDRQESGPVARNPRAVVEAVLGNSVNWSEVSDPAAYVEEILGTPYELLFDPKYGSPTYLGYTLGEDGTMLPEPPPPPVVMEDDPTTDDQRRRLPVEIRKLGDLEMLLGGLSDVPVRGILPSRAGGWTVEVGLVGGMAAAARGRIFTADVLDRLGLLQPLDLGWTPSGTEWRDVGTFFNNAAEYFDPVQGGIGDCGLVAAMSSVAWAKPTAIMDRQRATGVNNDEYKHKIVLTDPDSGEEKTFEVSNRTLVSSFDGKRVPTTSSESNEVWPAILEKAFAQWRLKTKNDRPNLGVLNRVPPVWAMAALAGGGKRHVRAHDGSTAGDLTAFVQSHCKSGRTIHPMTAQTYPSSTYPTAPAGLNYSGSGIVADHAYSVLGWVSSLYLRGWIDRHLSRRVRPTRLGRPGRFADEVALVSRLSHRDYVILRNPWGYHDAEVGTLTGSVSIRDVDFWRTIDLSENDGVFAVDFDTFQRYFGWTGVVV